MGGVRLFIERGGWGKVVQGTIRKFHVCVVQGGPGRRSYDCEMQMGRRRTTKVKQTSET